MCEHSQGPLRRRAVWWAHMLVRPANMLSDLPQGRAVLSSMKCIPIFGDVIDAGAARHGWRPRANAP